MKNGLNRFTKSKRSKYLIVWTLVYLIELLVILLAQMVGTSDLVAVGISFWVGLVISFLLQKFVTFQDKRLHHKVILSQIIAVIILVLFNFGFTLLCTKILSQYLPVFVIRAGAIGVTTLWNYYLYKSHIFNRENIIPID